MALDISKERGVALDKQEFDWKDLVQTPYSKLDDDAFTRVRVILMNGIESESIRFSHACARMNKELRVPLARVRRIDQFQQILVNWLNPPDQSVLETTIGFEQTAIEVTAALAQQEPDPYVKQCYDFGLLEDFDHLYRFSALMDRVEGRDSNNILQCYTDIIPGRPTSLEHRSPENDVREPYDKATADPMTKLNALVLVGAENQVHDYYANVGPTFSDPIARQLYAEILMIEEQHVTHYESLIDPTETLLEKWLMHEAAEVWTYWSCMQQEPNARLKRIWERFLAYELGQMHFVRELLERIEKRDASELLPASLPEPVKFASQRKYIRDVLENQVDLRANGARIVPLEEEAESSIAYRERVNRAGSPSERVAAGYKWSPGTELAKPLREKGNGGRAKEVTP